MIRRPAVTLIEVLISMFIMAIGMLALLVLFPLGAISMGQALKDDRCASTAAMAGNVAIAMNVRYDPTVLQQFVAGSSLVYVDPYGANQFVGNLGAIPRVAPSFASPSGQDSNKATDRWFSLPDDITFLENGLADTVTTGGDVDRGRRYSYAYLLRHTSNDLVQLYVVVYSGRPINLLKAAQTYEWSYPVISVSLPNGLQIAATGTTAKRGGWILDPGGNFYRITNIAENGGNTTLETEQNLQVTTGESIIIMDYVAEVFDKGTIAQP